MAECWILHRSRIEILFRILCLRRVGYSSFLFSAHCGRIQVPDARLGLMHLMSRSWVRDGACRSTIPLLEYASYTSLLLIRNHRPPLRYPLIFVSYITRHYEVDYQDFTAEGLHGMFSDPGVCILY